MLVVISIMTYAEMAPVMVGYKIIDRAMEIITEGDPAKVTVTWSQAHFSMVMSASLQLPPNVQGGW